ncbi:hypothetical protein PV387_32855 [Streptomyces sp. ME02-6987-2C]|uniref:erythromycin esterase family protein n=1 Tax=Streptomyces TaxID=1883 RepID=UPI001396756C|nr:MULTISPECIES: erythromycin esterase family protein [unclassified Streptomyces]MDX3370744.1 hypothetical protein [Streptomyces sp. ME02-6987-2C]MDX3402243.1 hypothetical protein [Streptomyces sp. ME01-18h]MDX3426963.1 hypothetical protein [Streptomyces sp. ME02-6985-2c]
MPWTPPRPGTTSTPWTRFAIATSPWTSAPPARAWLDTARPTRSYGLYWSDQDQETALGRSYDIVIHLHRVEAARLRTFTSVKDGQSYR